VQPAQRRMPSERESQAPAAYQPPAVQPSAPASQPASNPIRVPQAPSNVRPAAGLPPTNRQMENTENSIDLNTLAPISSAEPRKNASSDLRVSANQTNNMRNQSPPVKPEDMQILPGLPDRHSGKKYNLQVGSFSALETANRAAALMKDVGFDVKIEYSGAVYRVMAMKIASSDVYTASVRLGALGFGQIWIRE